MTHGWLGSTRLPVAQLLFIWFVVSGSMGRYTAHTQETLVAVSVGTVKVNVTCGGTGQNCPNETKADCVKSLQQARMGDLGFRSL